MGKFIVIVAALASVSCLVGSAAAETKTKRPMVIRSAAGTVIQPTRTIIHHNDGSTTVIVVPRRSYLDPGTDVSIGEPGYVDYAFPPDGDPGRPNWFMGPDVRGAGRSPLPGPYQIPGINPYTPF